MRRWLLLTLVLGLALAGGPAWADVLAAGWYRVTAIQVTVEPTRALGIPWDLDRSPPDPVITLTLDDREIARCPVQIDTLEARCQPAARFPVDGDALLRITVHDQDVAVDDFIGEARLPTSRATLGISPMDIEGRLVSAHIEIVRPGALSELWYAPHGRALALLGGILFALLLLLPFRPFWRRRTWQRGTQALTREAAPPRVPLWHSPILVAAVVLGLAGIGLGAVLVLRDTLEPPGVALLWALAGASLTFTAARIHQQRRLCLATTQALLIGAGALLVELVLLIALGVIVLIFLLAFFGFLAEILAG